MTERRRLAVRAAVRTITTVVVAVALYYLLPFTDAADVGSIAVLVIGLGLLLVVMGLQVRAILGSPYPAVQAIEALAFSVPFYLLLFAVTYFLMEESAAASFSEPMNRTDALYFTVTVFATVGFGDITPVSQTARIVVTLQMLANLVLLGIGLRLIVGAVRRGRARGGSERAP